MTPHQHYSKSEALEIAEAMIIMKEIGEYVTTHAGNTPGVSEAICMSISPIPPLLLMTNIVSHLMKRKCATCRS